MTTATLDAPTVERILSLGKRARLILRAVANVAAKERMRFALNGVQIQATGGKLRLTATDGRRLLRVEAEASAFFDCDAIAFRAGGFPDTEPVLVSGDALRAIRVRDAVTWEGGRLGLLVGETFCAFPETEGVFPGVDDVIPAKHARLVGPERLDSDAHTEPVPMGFNPVLLGGLLKSASDIHDGDVNAVRFSWVDPDAVATRLRIAPPLRLDGRSRGVEFTGVLMPVSLD